MILSGSPPRMRGKRQNTDKTNKRTGITPADAGKTSDRYSRRRHGKDHPRGCGENRLHEGCLVVLLGSPPRMRGKLHVCGKRQQHLRITPADAGKTLYVFGLNDVGEDHPRGCGENSPFAVATRFLTGSPPRMRGKHLHRRDDVRYTRITPADAGKTGSDSA